MLERREQEMQIVGLRLRAGARADPDGRRFPALARQFGLPFAVAAVEQQHPVATLEPQHVDQIVGPVAVEGEFLALGERRLEIQAGGAEIVARHGVIGSFRLSPGNIRRRPVGIASHPSRSGNFARFAAFPTYSRGCYKRAFGSIHRYYRGRDQEGF